MLEKDRKIEMIKDSQPGNKAKEMVHYYINATISYA